MTELTKSLPPLSTWVNSINFSRSLRLGGECLARLPERDEREADDGGGQEERADPGGDFALVKAGRGFLDCDPRGDGALLQGREGVPDLGVNFGIHENVLLSWL